MLKIMQFVIAVAPIEPKSNNAVLTQAIVIVVRRRSIWGHVALYFLRGKPAVNQWQSCMRGCVTCAIISEERADVGSFLALALAASRSMCTWFVLSGFCQPRGTLAATCAHVASHSGNSDVALVAFAALTYRKRRTVLTFIADLTYRLLLVVILLLPECAT